MRHDVTIEEASHKARNFTESRQDAALQAGHMHDFVRVALLGGALFRALKSQGSLGFEELGHRMFAVLELSPEHFM